MFSKLFNFESNEEIRDKADNDYNNVYEIVIRDHEELIDKSLESYLPILRRKLNQLIYMDEYGDYVTEAWDREVDVFVSRKLFSLKNKMEEAAIFEFSSSRSARVHNFRWSDDFTKILMRVMINKVVTKYIEQNKNESESVEIDLVDPINFEKSIAQLFEFSGWKVALTKASGDQGADVIATNSNGFKIIVQCKLYTQPIGNSAVQEVYSALSHYEGNVGMVVTNSTFTNSARQLAESCNILLVHYEDLSRILTSFYEEES